MAPATTITSDSTAAKIGRSTKNLENLMARCSWKTEVRLGSDPSTQRDSGLTNDGRHLRARSDALQAVDDDRLARRKPRAHDAQAVDEGAERDRSVFDLVVRSDDMHELLLRSVPTARS